MWKKTTGSEERSTGQCLGQRYKGYFQFHGLQTINTHNVNTHKLFWRKGCRKSRLITWNKKVLTYA